MVFISLGHVQLGSEYLQSTLSQCDLFQFLINLTVKPFFLFDLNGIFCTSICTHCLLSFYQTQLRWVFPHADHFSHLLDSPDTYLNTLVSSFWAFTSPGWTTPAFSASAHMRDTPVLMISRPCIGLSPVYLWLFCTEEPRSGSIPRMDSPRLYRGEGPPLSACWQQFSQPVQNGIGLLCHKGTSLTHVQLSSARISITSFFQKLLTCLHMKWWHSPSVGLRISCY